MALTPRKLPDLALQHRRVLERADARLRPATDCATRGERPVRQLLVRLDASGRKNDSPRVEAGRRFLVTNSNCSSSVGSAAADRVPELGAIEADAVRLVERPLRCPPACSRSPTQSSSPSAVTAEAIDQLVQLVLAGPDVGLEALVFALDCAGRVTNTTREIATKQWPIAPLLDRARGPGDADDRRSPLRAGEDGHIRSRAAGVRSPGRAPRRGRYHAGHRREQLVHDHDRPFEYLELLLLVDERGEHQASTSRMSAARSRRSGAMIKERVNLWTMSATALSTLIWSRTRAET